MFTCRPLGPNDSQEYRNLRLRSLQEYPEQFGSNFEEQLKLPKLFFQRVIESDQQKGMMIGCFHQGQMCGLLGCVVLDKHLGEIVQMYVTPEVQNQGLGTQLFQTLLDHVDTYSIKTLILEVVPSNAPAIQLYEKLGFSQLPSSRPGLLMQFDIK